MGANPLLSAVHQGFPVLCVNTSLNLVFFALLESIKSASCASFRESEAKTIVREVFHLQLSMASLVYAELGISSSVHN